MEDSTLSHKCENADDSCLGDMDTSDLCFTSSFVSNGSSEHVKTEDEPDARTNAVLENLGQKMVRVREMIKTEQKLRDGKKHIH